MCVCVCVCVWPFQYVAENFGCLEAVKTVSDLVMPVAGEVVEVNGELESKPDLINKQPYGDGKILCLFYCRKVSALYYIPMVSCCLSQYR